MLYMYNWNVLPLCIRLKCRVRNIGVWKLSLHFLVCCVNPYYIQSFHDPKLSTARKCRQFWSLYKSITMTLTGIFLVPIDGTRLSGHNSLWTSVLWEWEVPVHVSRPFLLLPVIFLLRSGHVLDMTLFWICKM